MLLNKELKIAIRIARKYSIDKLYLIGSLLYNDSDEVNDYDFAVAGVPDGDFFKFYGELYMAMSKPVDLIDLSGKRTLFKKLVRKEGRLIYDRKTA